MARLDVFEVVGWNRFRLWQVFGFDEIFFEPLTIRCGLGNFLLHFAVFDDAAGFHVDQEHTTWLEAALLDHILWLDAGEHTHFGCQDDLVVRRDVVARGA